MRAAAEEYHGFKPRGLGQEDLLFSITDAHVQVTSTEEDSRASSATIVFENVAADSKQNGWTVEPFSSPAEVSCS